MKKVIFLKSYLCGKPVQCLVSLIAILIKHSMISNLELPGKMEKVEALSAALLDLPASHYETLKYLLAHLYRYVPCYECRGSVV